ncbi:MAG: hypothetical protein JWN01_354 [Patescibacteria group bacterium]|jgi:hypothetical protein|nr:hypothetical protein [Patescibacteria group bacterium]
MLKLTRKKLLVVALVGVNTAALTMPFMANADTQTSNTSIGLTVNPVIISYSSGPTVTLGTITPDATGRQSTASDTVTADTNDTAGYTVTLKETSATVTDMVSGSNLITASTGTPGSPVTLTNGKWGWRVDSLAGFGAGPGAVISSAVPSALTYAGIPANATPYTIKTTSATGSNSATVWYSARVNNTQPIGTYSTTVTYTITTN